jgi:NAD(P)-dependent dehydrogenase (short-subunit alcohol dehydrogenase family)
MTTCRRLQGAVAVITGGASGIGAATARRFVAEGARVVVADLQLDLASVTAGELGDSAVAVRVDVTTEADVAGAIDLAVDRFGRLDVMVNNAGIVGVVGPIAETPMDDYDRTMAILLRGVFVGIKHAARVMVPQGSGVILTTSSVGGLVGGRGPHVYSAAKAGVLGLTRSAAAELRHHGIRVNAIVPGSVWTPLLSEALLDDRHGSADEAAAVSGDPPFGRYATAEDIAAAAAYLASEDGSYVTGEALVIDGGLTHAGGAAPFARGALARRGVIGAVSS